MQRTTLLYSLLATLPAATLMFGRMAFQEKPRPEANETAAEGTCIITANTAKIQIAHLDGETKQNKQGYSTGIGGHPAARKQSVELSKITDAHRARGYTLRSSSLSGASNTFTREYGWSKNNGRPAGAPGPAGAPSA